MPTVPFQLPARCTYTGLRQMMDSELDFMKAAVLSRSMEPVFMYSDMPMTEMAKDAEFPKKWMFGMAMLLKKGLKLQIVHNIDRSLPEMMLGLESFIPMYMTGQIEPYYFKTPQGSVFLHFLRVSGTAALSGEAVAGHHAEGRYYLTNNRAEVAYYRRRADALLENARPLMDIYREDKAARLNAFLLADSRPPDGGAACSPPRRCTRRSRNFWTTSSKSTPCPRRSGRVCCPSPAAAGSRWRRSSRRTSCTWSCPA